MPRGSAWILRSLLGRSNPKRISKANRNDRDRFSESRGRRAGHGRLAALPAAAPVEAREKRTQSSRRMTIASPCSAAILAGWRVSGHFSGGYGDYRRRGFAPMCNSSSSVPEPIQLPALVIARGTKRPRNASWRRLQRWIAWRRFAAAGVSVRFVPSLLADPSDAFSRPPDSLIRYTAPSPPDGRSTPSLATLRCPKRLARE